MFCAKKWEYWPLWAFYLPLIPYYLFLSCKSRSFGFWNAVNPAIPTGGLALVSKNKIQNLFPPDHFPKTLYIENKLGIKAETIEIELYKIGIEYPFIAKPDLGVRGKCIQKITNLNQLKEYISQHQFAILFQELIQLPNEMGVFIAWLPKYRKFKITGIVKKHNISIVGDGEKNILDLINKKSRYRKHASRLLKENNLTGEEILEKNQTFILSEIGTHNLGSYFEDITEHAKPFIEKAIFNILTTSNSIQYGRFDIRYNTLEEIALNHQFKIIEFNGTCAEPTHMYDSKKHNFFFAIKELHRHYSLMQNIAQFNKKEKIGNYLTLTKIITMLQKNKINLSKLKPNEN